jgi:hypothetical protein
VNRSTRFLVPEPISFHYAHVAPSYSKTKITEKGLLLLDKGVQHLEVESFEKQSQRERPPLTLLIPMCHHNIWPKAEMDICGSWCHNLTQAWKNPQVMAACTQVLQHHIFAMWLRQTSCISLFCVIVTKVQRLGILVSSLLL